MCVCVRWCVWWCAWYSFWFLQLVHNCVLRFCRVVCVQFVHVVQNFILKCVYIYISIYIYYFRYTRISMYIVHINYLACGWVCVCVRLCLLLNVVVGAKERRSGLGLR